jgi:hypothetical protein
MSSEPTVANELRDAIEQQIAQNSDFGSHAARLEGLREQFQHSIILLPFDEEGQDCNCVMYALDFRMEEPLTLLGRFYANTDYLRRLIDQGRLVEAVEVPADKLLAVYWDGDSVKHVGVAGADGRIASKWGIGFLYKHSAWEVPLSYGNSIRYFAPINPDQAFDFLNNYLAGQ